MLNNYNDDEYEKILKFCTLHKKFILGKEVGENGTPHIQGYVEFENGKTLTTLKKLNNRIHWEPAKGSIEDNYKYCIKDNNYITNIEIKMNPKEKLLLKYENVKWYDWQQKIIDICDSEPDSRTINWIYDFEGNKGKTYLCKYLYLTNNIVIADGKKDNVYHNIAKKIENNEEFKIVILDIPRHNLDYINYGVLEKIKDGMFYSGKYEGTDCIFDNVHLFVFANTMPDMSKFSKDRWNVIKLE